MIPILQFDPASLTLWYDAQFFARCRGSRELGLAFEYAVTGEDRSLQRVVACASDSWIQTRAANIASAVWHEKRHFLDFVLSNYGALRIRQFFELYVNAGAVVQTASTSGRLLVPLDSNLDPLTREMAGVGELDEQLVQVAKSVASRKAMLVDDRRPMVLSYGTFEIGGEGLLEAIAYHVQHGKTHRVFGFDMNRRVQGDQPGEQVVHAKYKWAYELLCRVGLLRVARAVGGSLYIDDSPFLPICYAALAGRFWGQPQVRDESSSSYLPGERFASLVTALAPEKARFAGASCEAAWEMVNQACKRLFGRTVLEEIEADYNFEEDFVTTVSRTREDTHVARALVDLHQLRGRLIGILKSDPDVFLDQGRWADACVNFTQPFVVAAAPAGQIGEPPKDHARLTGYAHPDTDFEEVPEGRWWWAAMNEHWPDLGDEKTISLRDREAWNYVTAEYAPLAKLLYSGHNMRLMLGPELFSARLRFQEQTGLKIVIDPAFAYPRTTHDAAFWYFMTGRDNFRCELSSETVTNPEGYMLDPWDLRLRPKLQKALLGTVADQKRMLFTLWRDWSPWLLSDEFRDYFESFEADEAGFYDRLH